MVHQNCFQKKLPIQLDFFMVQNVQKIRHFRLPKGFLKIEHIDNFFLQIKESGVSEEHGLGIWSYYHPQLYIYIYIAIFISGHFEKSRINRVMFINAFLMT